MSEIIVETKQGLLKGKTGIDYQGNNYFSFLGVPYAKPPLGKLRFKAPQPLEPWKGIRDATVEGEECYSRHIFFRHFVGSEDCLHLNIFTPELPSKDYKPLKPVMVFFFNGAFITGSNKTELYGPEFLLTEKVVLVMVNYRIGVLGFLSLDDPSLDVPGNAGLKDAVMSLKWVKDNIRNFGGDPDNILAFGDSAGAAIVHLLMLSPLCKGLFHKAILQSGCALNFWVYGRKIAKEMATNLNCKSNNEEEILHKLQSTPVEALLRAQDKLEHDFSPFKRRPIAPVVEKPSKEAFITQDPEQIILSGNYNKIPFMVGFASRDGMLMEITEAKSKDKYRNNDFEFVIPHTYGIKQGSEVSKNLAGQVQKFYFNNGKMEEETTDLVYRMITDAYFLEGIHRSVQLHLTNMEHPIYYFRFSSDTQLNIFKVLGQMKRAGACHGDILGYLFKSSMAPHITPGSFEEVQMRKLIKFWSNFAYFGNPNGKSPRDGSLYWEPVQKGRIHFIDIGENVTVGQDPEKERMEFWKRIKDACSMKPKL